MIGTRGGRINHCSRIRLFVTPWTVACQAPLSMGFSRQEYRRGLPCSSPGDLPDPGNEHTSLMSPNWQAASLPLVPPRNTWFHFKKKKKNEKKTVWKHRKSPQLKSKLEKGKLTLKLGFPGGSAVKNPLADRRDMGLIPWLGSSPGGGHGNSLQYFCLENSTDRGVWRATGQEVSKGCTQLRDQTANKLKLYLDNSSYLFDCQKSKSFT